MNEFRNQYFYPRSLAFNQSLYLTIWKHYDKNVKSFPSYPAIYVLSALPPHGEDYFGDKSSVGFGYLARAEVNLFTDNCGVRAVSNVWGSQVPLLMETIAQKLRSEDRVGALIGSDYTKGTTILHIREMLGWSYGPEIANPNMGPVDSSDGGVVHPIQFFWRDISNINTQYWSRNWQLVPMPSKVVKSSPQTAIFVGTSA